MVALDDTLPAPDGAKTLLDLAATGALVLARSGCFRDAPDAPPRSAWWALEASSNSRYEISGSTFRALIRLGVPVARRARLNGVGRNSAPEH
jgi:hypothetical protein